MDGTITSAGTITGELSAVQTLSGELTRPSRELYPVYVGVQDVEVDGVSVVTDSVASIDLTGKADVSSLATVATTGDYDDLTDKPTIPSKTSDLTNDSGFITDVEIDGTSIVTNGVAEIPHATNNAYGVVKATSIVAGNTSTGETYTYGQITYGNGSNLNLAATALATTSKRGLMSKDDKAKLDGIASGAEANVQSDWSQSDSTADDYIKNKPTIPSKTSDLTNDSGFITASSIPAEVFIAEFGVTTYADIVAAIDAGKYVLCRKPTSVAGIDEYAALTQTVTSTQVSEVNRYINFTRATRTDTNIVNGIISVTHFKCTYSNVWTYGSLTVNDGAEKNIQSDWNESDSTSDAYIANKPTIPTVPTNVSAFTNDAGYLTSYTETDPTVPSWAKASSKPSYTFSEIGTTPTSISGYGITDAYTKSEIDGLVSGVLHYKGTKATTSALPSSGNTTGDVWHITADGSEWAWDGIQWQELGTAVDLSGYVPTSRTVNGKALSSNISLTASDVSALPSSTVIPTITDTYSGTSSNGMSGKAVKSAIDALDGTVTGTAGAGKTLTAFSQTDGKVSATFDNISITKSQISDFPTIPTVNNATLTIQKNGTTVNTFTANASSDVTANISVPTKVSDLTNDSGFLTLATLPIYNGGVQ